VRLLRAWSTLFMLSFHRLLWSTSTLMVTIPMAGCFLFLLYRRYGEMERFSDAFNRFGNEFAIAIFASFVVPVCALAYATTSIGGDREDGTLLFLLVRPVPRWLILLAKLLATLPLVVGLVTGSFYVFCQMAGPPGQRAFSLFLPSVFFISVAYVCLFHLFDVSFRHSTIIALIYSLFMEIIIGQMPGIIKRVAVNFYGRSMMYELGMDQGIEAPPPEFFVPVSAREGALVLLGIAAVSIVAAMIVFQRREYRDLT